MFKSKKSKHVLSIVDENNHCLARIKLCPSQSVTLTKGSIHHLQILGFRCNTEINYKQPVKVLVDGKETDHYIPSWQLSKKGQVFGWVQSKLQRLTYKDVLEVYKDDELFMSTRMCPSLNVSYSMKNDHPILKSKGASCCNFFALPDDPTVLLSGVPMSPNKPYVSSWQKKKSMGARFLDRFKKRKCSQCESCQGCKLV